MRRSVALVVVLVLAGASVGYYAVGSSADEEGKTLRFVNRTTSFQFVDNAPAGESAGDLFTFAGDVFASKDGKAGKKLGRIVGSCTAADVDLSASRFIVQCQATYMLKRGQIIVAAAINEGAEGPHKFRIAILGGSGDFRKARGDGVIVERSEEESLDTLHLR